MSSMNARVPDSQPPGAWLKRCQPQAQANARLRLVCFPFAGAGANTFRQWPKHLDPAIDTLAVQLPGREARLREPCVPSADAIVSAVIAALMASGAHQPIAIYGHSMGSLLAYELARRLEMQCGWTPRALVVSGRLPPHQVFGGDLHTRSDEALIAAIQRLKGTPAGIFEDEEMRRLVLPVIRSDYQVVETYRVPAERTLSCPLGILTSDDDADAPPQAMTAWRALSTGPFSRWDFKGDHFFLREQAGAIAAVLNPYLLAAQRHQWDRVDERAY